MTCCMPIAMAKRYANKVILPQHCEYIAGIPITDELVIPANDGDRLVISKYKDLGTTNYKICDEDCCGKPRRCQPQRYQLEAKACKHRCSACFCEDIVLSDQDPVLNIAAELFGRMRAKAIDEMTFDHYMATVASVYAIHGTNGKVPTEFTRQDHSDVIAMLRKNCARTFFKCVGATRDIGTSPIPATYLVLGHTDLLQDIIDAFGCQWWGVERYNKCDNSCIVHGEFGAAEYARFFLTPYAPVETNATGDKVYNFFYLGEDAVWKIKQANYPPEFVFKDRMYSPNIDCYEIFIREKWGLLTAREENIVNLKVTQRVTA